MNPIDSVALLPLQDSLNQRPSRVLDTQRAFAKALNTADRRLDAAQTQDDARDAAERFVAATFVEPLLKQLRESNQAAAPFAPTEAEKSFGGFMDSILANEIVKAQDMPLVERLARDLRRDSSVRTLP